MTQPDGILLVDKEVGITSYDVIRSLKPLLPRKYKVGHAGTLDPFATGLLLILLGKATKLNDNLHKLSKEYEVVVEFGYETDTNDPTGKIIAKDKNFISIDSEKLQDTLKRFVGEIEQMPPQYSAKKVGGKKAYEFARKGIEVSLKPKEVTIHSLKVLEINEKFMKLKIVCSSGTYIRSLVSDIAKQMGTLATAVELRRTSIGSYLVENAIKSQDLKRNLDLSTIISIPEKYFIDISLL